MSPELGGTFPSFCPVLCKGAVRDVVHLWEAEPTCCSGQMEWVPTLLVGAVVLAVTLQAGGAAPALTSGCPLQPWALAGTVGGDALLWGLSSGDRSPGPQQGWALLPSPTPCFCYSGQQCPFFP